VDYYTYIGEFIAGPVYLVAGARLCVLSLRTGEASDRLLSVSLLLWSLSYFLYVLPYVFVSDESLVPLFFDVAWRIADYAADISFALFTRSVFRRHDRWAAWLVAGIAICLIVGVAGSVWVGDWEGAHPLTNPWYWLEWGGGIAAPVWMGVEGFHHYHMARQRLRLGLCEPLVCNRFLLWGLSGMLWMTGELIAIAQNIGYEITQVWSSSVGLVVASLDLSAVGVMWLVFFPPTFYRNWINKLATVADAVAEGSPHGG
jgi:hypothetical protein